MSEFGPQIDAIHGRYRARFANMPRATRDAALLESILEEARTLQGRALENGEAERLRANIELYERELEAIRQAQADGAARTVQELATWANFVQARYARSFAGQRRATRDLGMLAEMIEDAEELLERMKALSSDSEALREAIRLTEANLKIYRVERERIREDRKRVFGAERGTLLAQLANAQFQRYRLHFAKRNRLSRHRRILEHITDALQEVLDAMEALLADGFNAEVHKKNIALVKSNLEIYRGELVNLRTAHREAPLAARVNELGAAANAVFATYRENFAGKERKTRDLALLGDQIELLLHVAKGMDALQRAGGDEEPLAINAKNLALVLDTLHLYHREYAEVAKLQKA